MIPLRRQKGIYSGLAAAGICLALLLAAGANARAAAPSQQEVGPVWAQVVGVIPSTADLTGVFMLDQANAWVVGQEGFEGRAYRISFANGEWGMVATYSFRAPVRAISVVSDENVWVVGDDGLIAHRDVSGWHEVTNPLRSANLLTLQMLGNGEQGWAGGVLPSGSPDAPSRSVLLHYANGSWQDETPAGLPEGGVEGLHIAPDGGFATAGGTAVYRFSPTGTGDWSIESLPPAPPGCFGPQTNLPGVRALGSGEAWVVGTRRYFCTAPYPPLQMILHRVSGGWTQIPSSQVVGAPSNTGFYQSGLNSVSFNGGLGLAVGWQAYGLTVPTFPHIISYRQDGKWHEEAVPCIIGRELSAVSQADASHALAVGKTGTLLSYGYSTALPPAQPCANPTPLETPTASGTPLPTTRVPDPHDPSALFFAEVGHALRGGFRTYWQEHGGLAQFGYPLTEEFLEVSPTDGKSYTTQYFERARFEYHPENKPPYDVLLGLLGRTITRGREGEAPFKRTPQMTGPGIMYFEPTGHNMPVQFSPYWQSHGGLPVYGYPISEAFEEVSPTDGKPYLVQYFERNRLEYHPELPEPYRVSLGLLGVQVLQQRGWIR